MTTTTIPPNKDISHSEIDVYHRIISRKDIWAQQAVKSTADGKHPYFKKTTLTKELLIESLKTDELTIGAYCVDPLTQKTRNPIIDIDAHNGEADVREKVLAVYQTLKDCDCHPYIEASAGNIDQGAHIGIICSPFYAGDVREILKAVLEYNGIDGEVYPVQDNVSEENPGSLVKLPFQFNNRTKTRSEIVDPITLETLPREKGIEFMMNLPETDWRWVKYPGEDSVLNFDGLKSNHIPKDSVNHEKVNYKDIPKVGSFKEVFDELRYCFRENYDWHTETVNQQGFSWMTAVAAEIKMNGGSDQDVHTYFSVQQQYKRWKTAKHLKPINKKSIQPFRCETLRDRCPNYVLEYCPDCPTMKKQKLHEDLNETVDRTQGKEERTDGDIKNTEEQFDHLAVEVEDIFSGDRHLLLTNHFNGGKTWTAVNYIKRLGQDSRDGKELTKERINYIVPLKEIKSQLIKRFQKCGISFLDNPSTLDLCPRSAEFAKLKYIPSIICNNCPQKGDGDIHQLEVPLKHEYYDNLDKPFQATIPFYEELAGIYDTCPKHIYYTFSLVLPSEPLVSIMTAQKFSLHLFVPKSNLIKSIPAQLNIIDQIDFVDRVVPHVALSEKRYSDYLREFGIMGEPDKISLIEEELEEMLKGEGIGDKLIKKVEHLNYIKQFIFVEKRVRDGIFRRVRHMDSNHSDVITYDVMGNRPLNLILNDPILAKHRPDLHAALVEYLEKIVVEPHKGIQYAPLKFSKVLEMYSGADKGLFMTSTPTELELMDDSWTKQFLGQDLSWTIASNLYEMQRGSGIANQGRDGLRWNEGSIIYSRKMPEDEYINKGDVRGNTGTTDNASNIVAIDRLQYPQNSFERAVYDIQLCGGDMTKGVRIWYQQLVADAVTQPQKGKTTPEKVYMPNAKLLRDMGITILRDEKDPEKLLGRLINTLKKYEFIYPSQTQVSIEDLDFLVSSGYLIKSGKKYLPSDLVSGRV